MSRPIVCLSGQDSNVFNLMLIAGRSLDEPTKMEMVERVTTESHSFEDSINIIGEYVAII